MAKPKPCKHSRRAVVKFEAQRATIKHGTVIAWGDTPEMDRWLVVEDMRCAKCGDVQLRFARRGFNATSEREALRRYGVKDENALPPPANGTAPAPASTSASTAAPANDTFAVNKVVVGDAVTATHAVSQPKDTIAADRKAIYASVVTNGKTDGATLSARWSYLEGKGQLVSAISQSIATDGPAVTTFKIQNPHLWPAGKYKVEIALDGKPVSTQSFEIKAS